MSWKHYWENFKITDHNIDLESWKLLHSSQTRLLGQTTQQPSSHFGHLKPWKYKQFLELRPGPSCLQKSIVSYNFNFYLVHAFFHKQHFCKQRKAEIAKKIIQMISNTLRLNFCYYSHTSFTVLSKNNRTYSKKKKKKMGVCIYGIIWLIIVKMMMKMKNRPRRHDINSPRSRNIVNIRIVSVW